MISKIKLVSIKKKFKFHLINKIKQKICKIKNNRKIMILKTRMIKTKILIKMKFLINKMKIFMKVKILKKKFLKIHMIRKF